VRTGTEGRPQQGISFLLIDMKSPGITLKPITMLDGEHEINEIWFDNVRVPARNLVGDENKGWTYAKFLLTHERTNNAGIGSCKRALKNLKEIAAAQVSHGRPLIEDSRFRDRIAQVELELMALEITNLRVLSATASESRALGPEVSVLKIKGSEIQQTLAELQMQALGPDALPYLREALEMDWVADPSFAEHYRPTRRRSPGNISTCARPRFTRAPPKSKKHHLADDPGSLAPPWTSITATSNLRCRKLCSVSSAATTDSNGGASSPDRRWDSLPRRGRSMPTSVSCHCRSRKNSAVSAATASTSCW